MEYHRIKVIDRWNQDEDGNHLEVRVGMSAPSAQDAVDYIADAFNVRPEDKRYLVLSQEDEKRMHDEFIESPESASDIMDSFGYDLADGLCFAYNIEE